MNCLKFCFEIYFVSFIFNHLFYLEAFFWRSFLVLFWSVICQWLDLHLKPWRLYLLLGLLLVLLSVLRLPQQVGEGQRLQGAGPGGSGVPEGIRFSRVLPTSDWAKGPRPHTARRVDAVDANHFSESLEEVLIRERLGGELVNRTKRTKPLPSGLSQGNTLK